MQDVIKHFNIIQREQTDYVVLVAVSDCVHCLCYYFKSNFN